jgi:two-component system response regulator YesN
MYTYVIIDDEELIRKGTQKKISPLSDRITCIGEAENGLDGIEKIKELHPDIVILDMQMPGMDGMQLLPYLSEHYPNLPLIVISGYRDFDYIKQAISAQAIDYILKPFSREAIQKCVLSAIDRLESQNAIQTQLSNSEEQKEAAYYECDLQILRSLILGYHTDSTTISSQRLHFINQLHDFILLTMHFTGKQTEEDIQEWLEEHGFGDLALYLSNPNDKHMGFLLLFIPEDSILSGKQLTRQIAEAFIKWSQEQDCPVLIGISQTHDDLLSLHQAFCETSDALNRQKLTDHLSNYYYYEQSDPRSIRWEKQDEFLFRIESGKTAEVTELTRELFRYYHSIPDFTLADAKYHCYQLSDQCRLILNYYMKQQNQPTPSNSMQNVVTNIFHIDELQNYYLQFFLNLTNLLKEQSVYASDDIIENIRTYMERNYQKDITQEYISYLFYINRSYLSTLFKAKTGEKFIDYLNGIRIEKSKELLRNSERKMYQVAKAVGYDNVKYFFRVFKKKTGITPEQYRLQYSKEP